MARYVFKTQYTGTTVVWENGRITAKLGVIWKLKEYNKAVQESGHGMGSAGAMYGSFPSANYLKTPIGTYLLLNSMEPTEVVEGDIDENVLKVLFSAEGQDEQGETVGTEDGGPGSGNFGHKGRPGQVGGSGKGGSKSPEAEKFEKEHEAKLKSRDFQQIVRTAHKTSDYKSFAKTLTPRQRERIQSQHKDCGTQETLEQYTQRLYGMMTSMPLETSEEAKREVAQGQDLTRKFRERPKEFEFFINDIVNQQGFDGLPLVVGKEEFEKAVQASKFIAQRAYSGDSFEQLDMYRDQLYNAKGEWYISCEHGASKWGQGMYCSANYDGVISEDTKHTMQYYVDDKRKWTKLHYLCDNVTLEQFNEKTGWNLSEDAFRGLAAKNVGRWSKVTEAQNKAIDESGKSFLDFRDAILRNFDADVPNLCNIETFTLTPDAKIANYEDLPNMLQGYSDKGIIAAIKGYDAIRTPYHGYTVILNRTKCIFLDPSEQEATA